MPGGRDFVYPDSPGEASLKRPPLDPFPNVLIRSSLVLACLVSGFGKGAKIRTVCTAPKLRSAASKPWSERYVVLAPRTLSRWSDDGRRTVPTSARPTFGFGSYLGELQLQHPTSQHRRQQHGSLRRATLCTVQQAWVLRPARTGGTKNDGDEPVGLSRKPVTKPQQAIPRCHASPRQTPNSAGDHFSAYSCTPSWTGPSEKVVSSGRARRC